MNVASSLSIYYATYIYISVFVPQYTKPKENYSLFVMAASMGLSSSIVLLHHQIIIIIFFIFSLRLWSAMAGCNCFCSIMTFGDSSSDSGNLLHYLHNEHPVAYPPNGETFFSHPTGRFCDGRIISDFLGNTLHFSNHL